MIIVINRTRRVLPVLSMLVIATMLLAGGCDKQDAGPTPNPPGGGGTPPANEVWMQNTAFNPAALTVDPGTTVLWVNKDNISHTVTSGIPGNPDNVFNSGTLAAGDSFRYTFRTTRTTYHYFCQIHPTQMQGTVTVR